MKRRCDHCAGALTVTARRAAEPKVFCSRSCKEAALKAELKHGREQSKPDRACRQCGVSMPRSMRSDAAYCSERCNSAAHSQTRKASAKVGARQERIDRAYIVARDKGVCHLCRRQVPAVLVTLDHIVPLALGGTHTADNLAVACLSCNCAKGSRPANEQLLLIG